MKLIVKISSISIIITVSLLIIISAEYYIRSQATYITLSSDSDKIFPKQSPIFLKKYHVTEPILVPNADVLINNWGDKKEDIRIQTNSFGFRGQEPTDPNSIKVLVLGDSITFGTYLEEHKTFTSLIANQLKKNTLNKTIDIINGGIGDSNLQNYINRLNYNGLKLNPDIIIFGIYLNDSQPPWSFNQDTETRNYFRDQSVLIDQIYRGIALRKWQKIHSLESLKWISAQYSLNWAEDRSNFNTLIKLAKQDWGALWDNNNLKKFLETLSYLKKIKDETKIPISVVIFPVSFQVYSKVGDNQPQKHIVRYLEQLQIPVLDLLPSLQESSKINLFFDHCHPNEEGMKIISSQIYEFILPQIYSLK